MILRDLVLRCRQAVRDTVGDSCLHWETEDEDLLWSNAEWVGYLTQAQSEYCERRPIRDSRSALTLVTVAADADGYASIDPRVLSVQRAVLAASGDLLCKRDVTGLDDTYARWEQETGVPTVWTDGLDDHAIRLIPKPTAETVVRLTVDRYPLVAFDWDLRDSQEPEIPIGDHLTLIEWACALAYLRVDEQTYDEKAAGSRMGIFEQQVGPRPTPHDRAVRRWFAGGTPETVGQCY